jgi:hypothetical protein
VTLHQKFDVQTGADREAETLVAGPGTRLDQLMKAWESKNASTARRMAGLGLLAVPLAACGGSGSSPEPEPDPLYLTTADDTLTGTDGDDVFTFDPDGDELGILNPGDVLDGGAGDLDTLYLTSEEADRASAFDLGLDDLDQPITTYNITNIEVLAIGATSGGADHVVDVAKLGGMGTVVTEGVLVGQEAVKESFTVAVAEAADGADSITVLGVVIQLASGEDASAIAAKIAAATYTDWDATDNGDGTVTFTAKIAGDRPTDVTQGDFEVTNVQNTDVQSAAVTVNTQGAAASAGTFETFTATFSNKNGSSSQSVVFDGVTFTLSSATTAINVAAGFVTAYNADANTNWTAVNNGDGTVSFTAKTVGDKTVSDASFTGALAPSFGSNVNGTGAASATSEVFTVTISGTAAGDDKVTFDGTEVQLTDGDSAEQSAAKIAAATYANWTAAVDPNDGTLVIFTAKTTGVVTDVVAGDFVFTNATNPGAPTLTLDVDNYVQGVDASDPSSLTLNNVASGANVVIAGLLQGDLTINVINISGEDLDANDVDGLDESLTLWLVVETSMANSGTVTVNGVEHITVDSSYFGDGPETGSSSLILSADAAVTLTVTGDAGVDFTGSTLGALVTFDASGASGDIVFAAGASTVDMTGGSGNDHFTGNALDNVFDLSAGGNDTVVLAGTKALNGEDEIIGFTGGAGGDVLDLNGSTLVTLQDANGDDEGIIFDVQNATGDLVIGTAGITKNNPDPTAGQNVYLVVDSDGVLDAGQVVVQATGANGEIILNNSGSAYVLVATDAEATTANLYRVYDSNTSNGNGNNVTASVELLGTVDLTNGFDTLTSANFL